MLVLRVLWAAILPLWVLGAAVPAADASGLTLLQKLLLTGDPDATHKVTFEISRKLSGAVTRVGELQIALFGTVVPRTVENFVQLANMTFGYGYKGAVFHRIIKDFMVQSGDFIRGDGSGGRSIYDGGRFDDENFVLKHNKLGRLSMANAGPNTNGGQFFITTNPNCEWLDGRHVVFGQVVADLDVLDSLNKVETGKNDRPVDEVFISNAHVAVLGEPSLTKDPAAPAKGLVAAVETAVPLEENASSGYSLLFFVCLVGAAGFAYKKWHYKRQLVTDIKDSNYF